MSAALESLIEPFWRARVIVGEPVAFIAEHDEPTVAHLLFAPDGPLTVTDTSGTTTFLEGRDFTVDAAGRRIVRTAGSRLRFVRPGELATEVPHDVDRRTALVRYVPAARDWFDIPADATALLPRTRERLATRQPLAIALLGDSISEGYDASGFRGVPPLQPSYATLVAEGLRLRSGSPVTLRNFAAAGSTAGDGTWVCADAAADDPDLVLIAFGMNDACYADADEFASHLSAIIERIHGIAPAAECLLVTPMLPTPATTWVEPARFPAYRDAMRALVRPGVALADVMTLWEAVLTRKQAQDLSGNGSNHPNDFGHRLYAHTILATLGQ